MIFLTLRNNRKLVKNAAENIRKTIFGILIAVSCLFMIMAFEIDTDQFKTVFTEYDIHYLTTLIISMASMPLTMFVLLAMNKNEYGKKWLKYVFEIIYISSCVAISSVFYMHLLSILWTQVAVLASSVVWVLLSFLLSRTHINYRATTVLGPLVVKPLSFDNKGTGVLGFVYLFLAFIFQGANIVYFNYVGVDLKNYTFYQFLIQSVSILFFLMCISVFSKSRSIGQSQEVLYYRYAQLVIFSLIFILIGIVIYRTFVLVQSNRTLVDLISIGINIVPITALFTDLFINSRRLKKNKMYQGMTEMRLLIKILSAIIFILVNMIVGVEAKFFMSGEVQANIDVTLAGLGAILIVIVIPFLTYWKKITKRSSRIITILGFIILSFIIYKFYFYADIMNIGSEIFGVPIDSIYTMVTLMGVLIVQTITIVLQSRSSGIAFRRYGHMNESDDKGVANG